MLELKNIEYSVEQDGVEKHILRNINLKIDNKENLVITGHNGSGKSTLLRIIMGIVRPTKGKIIFEGKDITEMSITDRAKLGICYAYQTPVCFKGLTVRKLLEISCGNKEKISDYCEILSSLGMCAREYLDREVGSKLSGGEQKRIEIASVLARKGKLNLFDEPEAGIDIWSFDKLISVFNKNMATNVIVSHQKRLIEKADKIILLNNGEIELYGESKDIMPKLSCNQYCDKLEKNNG